MHVCEMAKQRCKIGELPSMNFVALVFHLIFRSQLSAGVNISMITPGMTIGLNASLVSSNGTFAGGLRQIGQKEYGFAVWYARIADETIVWLANRNRLVAEDAQVTLTNDGDLALYDSAGALVWNSNTSRLGVVQGLMNETGNLVLLTKNGTSVWESFQSPTNTLLPNQQFRGDMKLVSNRSLVDASLGYYTLFVADHTLGNLSLSYKGTNDVYWGPDATSMVSTNFGDATFTLNSYGFLSFPANNMSDNVGLSSVPRRVTLDVDGNLRIYSWNSLSGSWLVVWQAVMNQCTVYGLCGPNGICRYFPGLTCHCPPGFHKMANNNQGGFFPGCARNVPLRCSSGNATSSSKLISLENTDFVGNDLDNKIGLTEESCAEACKSNCSCLAVAYTPDGTGSCGMKGRKEGYLLSGLNAPENPNTVFWKVSINDTATTSPPSLPISLDLTCPELLPLSGETRRHLWNPGAATIVVICIVELACFLLAWWFVRLRQIKRRRSERQKAKSDAIPGLLSKFTFKELQLATENFTQKLGEGGFGSVYKGILDGNREVAVKSVVGVSQGENEFRAEVATIGKIHHKNLVRLIGYCEEKERRFLVYEFMSNGSLDKHLFDGATSTDGKNSHLHLDWNARFQIILGTARALAYLHEECHDQILHCDIKPHNILLDKNLLPKVSDFGLAKPMDRERALFTSAIQGTRGYLAPEWVRNAPITAKADVYSFGLVMLEIVSGRRNYEEYVSEKEAGTSVSGEVLDLPSWPLLQQSKNARVGGGGGLAGVVDWRLGGRVKWREVEASMRVALLCVENGAAQRPTMASVVRMLEGSTSMPDGEEDADEIDGKLKMYSAGIHRHTHRWGINEEEKKKL